ncbi:hypothetical protein S40285_00286 [Stachybotrys chlorohalonatus IBT 40285]|uniref:Transcription factor Iwr1 domain-containing protein n=1 Tax=Stachybotrys chlorohalonatus (strain IBT 40285) TaxID=1283841 RepID=A0A084QHT9_STAC4|nr:hypothetical protein S40285_00286 [Stachybotrys chlorohalonata IBT 40285]
MSLPPQLIRVKRKRVDESPVTFLQLDQGAKRHRSDSHYVYQRRDSANPAPATFPTTQNGQGIQPVIQVSPPDDKSSQQNSNDATHASRAAGLPRPIARGKSPSRALKHRAVEALLEPRRFHISRSTLSPNQDHGLLSGVHKRYRTSPAVFVERSRRKQAQRADKTTAASNPPAQTSSQLKKPSSAKRSRPQQNDTPSHAPLPVSVSTPHAQDLDKIAADMNQWVLNEIGANLQAMEQDKTQQSKSKLRPKAPAKRYNERHPQSSQTQALTSADAGPDTAMTYTSSDDDSDDEDWVIDEYVRIPVTSMAVDIAPAEVGLLVIEGEEERILFYGSEQDEEEEMLEDDEDENAENYYTADYPEDEVETDDEFDRHAYLYRNGNASDEEEFDNREYNDSDEDDDKILLEGDDDDVTMARIRTYMQRHTPYQ